MTKVTVSFKDPERIQFRSIDMYGYFLHNRCLYIRIGSELAMRVDTRITIGFNETSYVTPVKEMELII